MVEAVIRDSFENGTISSKEDKGKLELVTNVFNKVAILLLVIAGLMAYFILLNITKMYVNQKTRELTIMRINGFTVREVKNYVGREMIMTTLIGIIIGLLAGSYIAYRIILLLEMINCFDRCVYFLGWLFAAAITGLFSAFISAQALRKVKHLKLTDI